jgi:hypothetical protein
MSTLQLPSRHESTFVEEPESVIYEVEHQLEPAGTSGRTWPTAHEWVLFTLQALLVVMIELGNDIVRGNIWPPNMPEAMSNARQVVHFEMAHNVFVEPALQVFFQHTHIILGIPLTWPVIVDVANNVYAFCHIFVTLAVAIWIFVRHRRYFPRLRNIMLLTNILALIGYEIYPMAPPRLTTGLFYNGHAVHFQDTMRHILGTGTLNGTPIGYNPFSAMPSLHVAWAIVIGGTIVLLARHPLVRAFGALYPGLMVFTVIVTANHYVMDAVGAAVDVTCATLVVLLLSSLFQHLGRRQRRAVAVPASEPIPLASRRQ